eukprot:TRINITY_DN31508_c1_g1_i1.p1 TRINITY_DN31508_c1_g1~~TRINITY_DN31508_c1_g1_i1.p1  ORF type:complete len:273 (+),score=31.13 TRINITY_DN31508_c1_g1_i1:62-880(+)
MEAEMEGRPAELVVQRTFLTVKETNPVMLRRSRSWSCSSSDGTGKGSESSWSEERNQVAMLEARNTVERRTQPGMQSVGNHVIYPDTSSCQETTSDSHDRSASELRELRKPTIDSAAANDTTTGDFAIDFADEDKDWRQGHPNECKPCAFQLHCFPPSNCRFCHLTHEEEEEPRKNARPSKYIRCMVKERLEAIAVTHTHRFDAKLQACIALINEHPFALRSMTSCDALMDVHCTLRGQGPTPLSVGLVTRGASSTNADGVTNTKSDSKVSL